MIHGSHLQADDAGADDQQAARHVLQVKRSGRVLHTRIVVRDEWQSHWLRTAGNNRLLEADQQASAIGLLDL